MCYNCASSFVSSNSFIDLFICLFLAPFFPKSTSTHSPSPDRLKLAQGCVGDFRGLVPGEYFYIGLLTAGKVAVADDRLSIVDENFDREVVDLYKSATDNEFMKKRREDLLSAVYWPDFYDMKLRIKRYWNGCLKFDSGHIKRVSRVPYYVRGVHHGDCEFKFCVYNALPKHKEFRITITPVH